MASIFLRGVVEECQRIPVIKEPECGTKHSGVGGAPRHAEPRSNVVARRRETGRHPLAIISDAHFQPEPPAKLHLVFRPETNGDRGELSVRIAESLNEDIRSALLKIG